MKESMHFKHLGPHFWVAIKHKNDYLTAFLNEIYGAPIQDETQTQSVLNLSL